jgi:hypothetical protein
LEAWRSQGASEGTLLRYGSGGWGNSPHREYRLLATALVVGAAGARCRRIGRSSAGAEARWIRHRQQGDSGQRRSRSFLRWPGSSGGLTRVVAFRSPRRGVEERKQNRPADNDLAAEDTRRSPQSSAATIADLHRPVASRTARTHTAPHD